MTKLCEYERLKSRINACTICAERFAATATAHSPRPVVWFRPAPPILIASQAPGLRVHKLGKPFWDRSGDRLRAWLGIDRDVFYNESLVSVLPTSFCFPGYNAAGSDLPPPRVCWETWHHHCNAQIGTAQLRIVMGKHAIARHLGLKGTLVEIVGNWRDRAPGTFVLPHPSWRNNSWLKAHPWFERELLPDLRAAVSSVLAKTAG